jgi:transposase
MDQAQQIIAQKDAEIAVLRALLGNKDALLGSKSDIISAQSAQIIDITARLHNSDLHIEKLRAQLAKFKRLTFGKSSEKIRGHVEQLELALEELEATRATLPVVMGPAVEKSPNPARKPLPDHLPRETVEHIPETGSCACPACGGALRKLGSDEADELDVAPVQFRIIRHVRPKFACTSCQKIVQASAPERAIEKGRASPNLLAHVLVAKYADHTPLYRQSEQYARAGVEIDRSVLAHWVGKMHHLLTPITDAIKAHVLAQDVLFTDDTPVPVLAPGAGKTKVGRLWTHVFNGAGHGSDVPAAVWFAYSADRKGEHPRTYLSTFKGHLHTDGFAGYTKLFESPAITNVACWGHARRKFYELHEHKPTPQTEEALRRIGELYAIESSVRGQTPEIRLAARKTEAIPQLDALHQWLMATKAKLSAKSDMARAINYALGRWEALLRYASDGRLEIDNLHAERSIRGVALGKKNWLFAGSDAGGARAAAIYSIIETCKLHKINPQAYLAHVITAITNRHPQSRLNELLPWNWAATNINDIKQAA